MTDATREGLADRVGNSLVEQKPLTAVQTLQKRIEGRTSAVRAALPTHLKDAAENYTRAAMSLVARTPALAECEPMTVLGGLMTASQLGLELGPLNVAYLVPYRNHGKLEAQLIIGYRGYIELAYRSGVLNDITAESVCEGDEFSFNRATGDITHTWDLHDERGKAYAWYAVANFRNGGRAFVVLNRKEVEKFRDHKRKAPDRGPWIDDFDAMAKKTCIRRLEPYLPKATGITAMLTTGFVSDGSISKGDRPESTDVEYLEYDESDVAEGEIVDSPSDDHD